MKKLFLKFRRLYDLLRFKLGIHPHQSAYRPDEDLSDWISEMLEKENKDEI